MTLQPSRRNPHDWLLNSQFVPHVDAFTHYLLPAPPVFNRHAPSVDLYLHLHFNPRSLHAQLGLDVSQVLSTAPEKMITIPALAKTTLPAQHKKEIRKWQLRKNRPPRLQHL